MALFSAVGDNLSYAYRYNEWWYFARQLFYPLGMTAGGVSLLLGSGVMKRRQRRFATYLRTAGQKPAVPLDYLARSIEFLAKADVAIFAPGWKNARGCRIEHQCAEDYGIPVMEV